MSGPEIDRLLAELRQQLIEARQQNHAQRARLYRQGKAIDAAWRLSQSLDWNEYGDAGQAAHKALDAALAELEGDPPPNAPRRVLISCCGPKRDHPAPARELYTSDLFRKSVAYAERRGLPWSVLSTRHGLVEADEEIAPYDTRLGDLGALYRDAWGQQVVATLIDRYPGLDSLIVLAGEAYVAPIAERFRAAYPDAVLDLPLARLQIGERLAFLNADAVSACNTTGGGTDDHDRTAEPAPR